MRFLVLSLIFLSGACGLVYQVVWVRMLTQVFGTTATSVGVVLAAFMSGLALGAWWLGKAADRSHNPLRFYALVEFGIAVVALAAHFALTRITPAYLALYELSGQSEAMLALARFVLAFVLVMAPTVLMGATLPVLTRFMLRRISTAGADLANLYAINTFGAVAGVLLCGFYLIGTFGIHVSVYLAVAGNLALGLVAWALSRRQSALDVSDQRQAPAVAPTDQSSADALPQGLWTLVLIALFLSGMTSFAYEIYWTRSLVFMLGNSTYALTTMLTAFISGIALGGYLVRFLLDRAGDRVALFGWLQVLIGALSATALPLLFALFEPQAVRLMLNRATDEVGTLMLTRFALAMLVMLPPATLIGATFPLVARIGIVELGRAGDRVGKTYAVNTLGNVIGALLPGFVLLNWLGIQRGILLMASINAIVGFALLASRIRGAGYLRWATPLAAVIAIALLARTPLDFQFPNENEGPSHRALFYRDGPSATTRVSFDPASGAREMGIDGIVIGGNTFTEYKQLLLAHLPKLLLDDVSTELSIGLGTGMLVGESLRHERVQRVTCVEIEPSVVAGAALFAGQNHGVLQNPRLRIVIDDVSNFLRTTADRYRVISADEKTSLDYASNGFSYSAEYYELLRRRLAPGGILVQWVPANLPPRQYAMVLKTFGNSFPHVLMALFMPAYRESGYNTILIGSEEKITLDRGRIERVMRSEAEALDGLARYGLETPEAVIAQFVADGEMIRPAVRNARLNTLVHPRYEFYSPGDYAVPLKQRVAANIEGIAGLKRAASSRLVESVTSADAESRERLKSAIAAELEFLQGYRVSLTPVDAGRIFHHYDAALKLAPWNQSLRSRISLHYRDIAASQDSPQIKQYLMQRARDAAADQAR